MKILFLLEVGSLIVVTGDIHGDLRRFDDPLIKKLRQGDSLIICGDFGFLWDNSEQEQKVLAKLAKKKYNILFVDGVHENFELLNRYEVTQWNSGRVHPIMGNIYHLMRGEIYEIEGKRVLAFGGGESPDKEMRVEAGTWWEQEMPSIQEMRGAVENLNRVNREVDYVVTHEPPTSVRNMLVGEGVYINALDAFLDELSKEVTYQKWFFGCMHVDRKLTSKSFAVFRQVIPAEPLPGGKRRG